MNIRQQLLNEFEEESDSLTIEGFLNFLVAKVEHLEQGVELLKLVHFGSQAPSASPYQPSVELLNRISTYLEE